MNDTVIVFAANAVRSDKKGSPALRTFGPSRRKIALEPSQQIVLHREQRRTGSARSRKMQQCRYEEQSSA